MFVIMVTGIFSLSLNSFEIRFWSTAFLELILPITLIVSFSLTGCSKRDDKVLFFKSSEKCLLDFGVFWSIFCAIVPKKLLNSSAIFLFVVNL